MYQSLKKRSALIIISCLLTLGVSPLMAKKDKTGDDKPSLSIIRYDSIQHPVQARNGMVVSQRKVASEIGQAILKRGGNAVDAAVAVGYALTVVLPRAGNIAGGGFMLVYLADKQEVIAIDYRERAPAAAERNMYIDEAGEVDDKAYKSGIKSVGVPGTVAGLSLALEKYGTMGLAEVVQPAIELAQEGFVMDYDTASALATKQSLLAKHPESRKLFFKEGATIAPGVLFKQPDLANVLKSIADNGADAFYRGDVADLIVAQMEQEGGMITHEDLDAYRPVERQPLRGDYRGKTIVTMPPPSSGGVHILQMLGVLSNFDMKSLGQGSADSLHLIAEAMRYAYADRSRHSGDADHHPVPVDWLTSKAYTKQIASNIDRAIATDSDQVRPGEKQRYESEDTTHFSVVDRDGNAVSNTYTLNYSFGSGVVVKGGGFILNNEMTDFNPKPDAPNKYGIVGGDANSVVPGKRPMSSMTPTMVFEGDDLVLVTGSPGGSRIINTVLQQLINVIDYDMNIASATHAPRIHHQWYPDRLDYEASLNHDTLQILKSKGHETKKAGTMGSLQSIHLKDGLLFGAADPRRPGAGVAGDTSGAQQ